MDLITEVPTFFLDHWSDYEIEYNPIIFQLFKDIL